MKKLIEIENLKTYFFTEAGTAKAVDGVNFDIYEGEVLGIVGESGSGKSVTSLSINRLIPNPPGDIVDGRVLFKGINLLDLSYDEMKEYRGKEIAMIFQEPMTSLNPVFKINMQMNEVLMEHEGLTWDEANLDKWLTNPKGMYPGTKMIYPGLKKAEDRADIIEYLKTK